MTGKKDYCQYYLEKCMDGAIPSFMTRLYKTVDDIREAYESSRCFLGTPEHKNECLRDALSSFMQRDCEWFDRLDIDARKILQRAINSINNFETYDDINRALSDYLWIEASVRLSVDKQTKATIGLTFHEMQENRKAYEWIEELKEKVDKAEYDLRCMEEADNLSVAKQIFSVFIENPDVAWYADKNNISYFERREEMAGCKSFIKQYGMIYFAFLITNLYHEKLRRRHP